MEGVVRCNLCPETHRDPVRDLLDVPGIFEGALGDRRDVWNSGDHDFPAVRPHFSGIRADG